MLRLNDTIAAVATPPGEGGVGEDIQLDLDLDRLILEGLRLADQERAARASKLP